MDAVVSWTDAGEPSYAARRAAEAASRGVAAPDPPPASRGEELRYCLRSLVQHAPWLRRIVVVTDGQWPSWLDEAAAAACTPPIVRADHAALHPEGRSLWTAAAVEAALHRVPALSQVFLYARSHMFLPCALPSRDVVSIADARLVGVVTIENAVTAAECTPKARAALAQRGDGEAASLLAFQDQVRLFERVSRQASPPECPRAARNVRVLCSDCLAYVAQHAGAEWRAAIDSLGATHPSAAAAAPPVELACAETTALWRKHCTASKRPATRMAAAGAAGEMKVTRAQRFLSIEGMEALPRAALDGVLDALQRLLPDALPCERDVVAQRVPDVPLSCWSLEDLERAVPRGVTSLAVVATALPQGVWRHGVRALVTQLRRHVAHVLVVHNLGPRAAVGAEPEWLENAAGAASVAVAGLVDGGLDFGQWARALRHQTATTLRRLVLANDSTFPLAHDSPLGAARSIDALFASPRVRAAEFWGVTDSVGNARLHSPEAERTYHVQSYFLVAEGGAATASVLQFLAQRDVTRLGAMIRHEFVAECEMGLTSWMLARGHRVAAAFPIELAQGMRTSLCAEARGNPSADMWDRLLFMGCPLLKRRLTRFPKWMRLLGDVYGADAAARAGAQRPASPVEVILLPPAVVALRAPPSADDAGVPRRIWAYWDGPVPDAVAACFASWRAHNPDWTLTVVTRETLHDYVPRGVRIEDAPTFLVKPTRTADWARLWIVSTHGGVWIDASMFAHGSLNWVHAALAAQRDAARARGRPPPCFLGWRRAAFQARGPVLESWCFAAPPQSPFLRAWRDEAMTYGCTPQEGYCERMVLERGLDIQGLPHHLCGYLAVYAAAMAVVQGVAHAPCPPCSLALLDAEGGPLSYLPPTAPPLGSVAPLGSAAALVRSGGAPPHAHAPFSKLRDRDREELMERPDRALAWRLNEVDAIVQGREASADDARDLSALVASLTAAAPWLRRIVLLHADLPGAPPQPPQGDCDCHGAVPTASARASTLCDASADLSAYVLCVDAAERGAPETVAPLRLCDVVAHGGVPAAAYGVVVPGVRRTLCRCVDCLADARYAGGTLAALAAASLARGHARIESADT